MTRNVSVVLVAFLSILKRFWCVRSSIALVKMKRVCDFNVGLTPFAYLLMLHGCAICWGGNCENTSTSFINSSVECHFIVSTIRSKARLNVARAFYNQNSRFYLNKLCWAAKCILRWPALQVFVGNCRWHREMRPYVHFQKDKSQNRKRDTNMTSIPQPRINWYKLLIALFAKPLKKDSSINEPFAGRHGNKRLLIRERKTI